MFVTISEAFPAGFKPAASSERLVDGQMPTPGPAALMYLDETDRVT